MRRAKPSVLEVRREPARPGPARSRWGDAAIAILGGEASVAPVGAPAASIRVADMLP